MSTAMDVAAWLRGLGLEQHERAFLDHHIDAEVLPELTAEDLTALGVTSIRHRKKLLKAIGALTHSGPPAVGQVAPTELELDRPTGVSHAERRQLTVLLCDLVGSTEVQNA